MVRVSHRLRFALLEYRAKGGKQYAVARDAGLHHSTLSALLHDICPIRENDARVLAVARVLGVPAAEAFEPYTRSTTAGPKP